MDDAETHRQAGAGGTVQAGEEPPCWACGTGAPPDAGYRGLGLHRCPACGLRFAPVASAEELRERYDADYFAAYLGGDYDADEAQRRHEAQLRVRWLRSVAPPGRVLEVGAASGWFLVALAEGGYRPEGVEPAQVMAREAQERAGVPVHACTLEEAPLEAGSFDAACAFHVVEHLVGPAGPLGRLREALRPGGVLLVEVPNIDSVSATRRGRAWPALDPAHHVAHYGPRSLRALLQRAGFAVERVETFPWPAYQRPGLMMRPGNLAGQVAYVLRTRTGPGRPHPHKHEMLRAVARVPAG